MNTKLDQYFTKNDILLKGFIKELKHINKDLNSLKILEPSVGEGDLIINCFGEQLYENITCVELDKTIPNSYNLNIIYDDFLKHEFDTKFDIIIMNPPFTYTAEFINKCYTLLNDDGYIICLCQDNTLKLTKNINLLKILNDNGHFTSIRKYTKENLFKNASIGVIIFTYHKYKECDYSCKYYIDNKYINNQIYTINPIFQFVTKNQIQLKNIFDVYVGFVSGADSILKVKEQSTKYKSISILKKEGKEELYYDISSENEANDIKQLITNKNKLINRKVKKFDNTNWFTFGLKRNENVIKENINKDCIYVYNQTRNNKIAFKDKVRYFGGNLLMLLPKINDIDLNKIVNTLNDISFKKEYITDNNRFKISHKQLSTSYITYEQIDNKLPNIMNEIIDFLNNNKQKIVFNKTSNDGRLNSSHDEETILNILLSFTNDIYDIFIPPPRWWFDFALINKNNNKFIPFNIKITTTYTCDNSAGYSSLAFALSDINMKYDKQYTNKIIDEIKFKENERDYWFLVINKQTKEIIINSIKGLSSITPNCVNLPFQIKWCDNKIYNPKTVKQTIDMIRQRTQIYEKNIPTIVKHISLFKNI